MFCCALFSVFMMVAMGLFEGMTLTVKREQNPAQRMAEGRLGALAVARRLRDCQAMVRPSLRELLDTPSQRFMLRDVTKQKTVEFQVRDDVLFETYYPWLYNPDKPGLDLPEKGQRLASASSLRLISGGWRYPTRVTVELTLTDGRPVIVVTNFREAI